MEADEVLQDWTAQEALKWWKELSELPLPEGRGLGFEARIVSKCLAFLRVSESDGASVFASLLGLLRGAWLDGDGVSQMADLSGRILGVLEGKISPMHGDARALSLIVLQLTSSLLSLIQRHAWLEKCAVSVDRLLKEGVRAEGFWARLCALEGTERVALTHRRLEEAGLDGAWGCMAQWPEAMRVDWWMSSYGYRAPESNCLECCRDQHLAQTLNSDRTAIQEYVGALLFAPSAWVYGQYVGMGEASRQDCYQIVHQKRSLLGLCPIDSGSFESWLERSAQAHAVARRWLLNEPIVGNSDLGKMFLGISKYEQGDAQGFRAWLRAVENGALLWDSEVWLEPCAWKRFVLYWLGVAWLESGQPKRALEVVQTALDADGEQVALWVLWMVCWLKLGALGEVEHALLHWQARRIEVSDARVVRALDAVGHALGECALRQAQRSREVEPSLLELAIRWGDLGCASEAALCALDGGAMELERLADLVCERPEVLDSMLGMLSRRETCPEAEILFSWHAHLVSRIPNRPELKLLEALSQWENAWMASETLLGALREIPEDHALKWHAAERFILLHASQGTFDEAIRGVVPYLGSVQRDATRVLMFLIASLPKSLRPMVQTALVQELGLEPARLAFERIRSYSGEAAQGAPPVLSLSELGYTLMPVEWQVFKLASSLGVKGPEAQAQASRRETVLASRGAPRPEMPVPDPAQWIHQRQPKASDGMQA